MHYLRCVLLTVVSVICVTGGVEAQSCSWAGRVYSDRQLLSTGGACQICNAGKWKDDATSCNKCVPTKKPEESNPPASNTDCTDLKGATPVAFSDGARIDRANGKRQRCSAGKWLDSDVPPDQQCH